MKTAARRSPADRDRAVARLRTLTIGTGLASVVAVGAFGGIAALSYDGTAAVTTAAIVSADNGTTADAAEAATTTTTTTSTTTTAQATAAPTATTGTAHATTGSS